MPQDTNSRAPAFSGARISKWIAVPVVAGLLIWLGVRLVGNPLGEDETLGRIVVDSPEIYTRERLVNDRLLQETWLLDQLKVSAKASQSLRQEKRSVKVAAGESGQPDDKKDSPKSDAVPAEVLQESDRARLMEAVDYRELVRNLTIENQLDDRHDLNGNSLYKLKFDASVLPGHNTQATAVIVVRLMPPNFVAAGNGKEVRSLKDLGTTADVQRWDRLYRDWIESLQKRLNETQQELELIFHNDEMSHSEYARFIDYIGRWLSVEPASVAKCRSMPGFAASGPLPLEPNEHAARKGCIKAILETTVQSRPDVRLPPPPSSDNAELKSGDYYLDSEQLAKLRPQRLPAASRAQAVSSALGWWLNSFSATKTLRLVLGAAVPEEAFQSTYYDVPALNELARLTFFNTTLGFSNVFKVRPRVHQVIAIDRQVSQERLDELWKAGRIPRLKKDDFVQLEGQTDPNFLVLDPESAGFTSDEVLLSREDFSEIADGLGVYTGLAHAGLLEFARTGQRHRAAFVYAATPKDSAETVRTEIVLNSQVGAGGELASKTKAGLQAQRTIVLKSLERRTKVVGFASGSGDRGAPEFGWLIAPRQAAAQGQADAYVQVPAQYALSALVSVPAWWGEVNVQLTTRWLDKSGVKVLAEETHPPQRIELPVDFEALETLLLGIEQIGPELMESRLDPVLLTACQPGAILIPGRRLWRSTKVTLGYQVADSISVLPNMKAIVAKFDRVENQMSVEEGERMAKLPEQPKRIRRTVRLWTSQGSLALPSPASIGIPADCKAGVEDEGN